VVPEGKQIQRPIGKPTPPRKLESPEFYLFQQITILHLSEQDLCHRIITRHSCVSEAGMGGPTPTTGTVHAAPAGSGQLIPINQSD